MFSAGAHARFAISPVLFHKYLPPATPDTRSTDPHTDERPTCPHPSDFDFAPNSSTLEAANLAGAEFSTLAVVAAVEEDCGAVEARCDRLAWQRQFIHDCGVQVLPNGETIGRYGFIHTLYQNVLYDHVSSSKRVELHRRIGERGEEVFGERAREIAVELAMHFERGGDYKRASKYLQRAADNAIRRFAYQEAVTLAKRVELLTQVPADAELTGAAEFFEQSLKIARQQAKALGVG